MNVSTTINSFGTNVYDITSLCPTNMTHFTPMTFTCLYTSTASTTIYLNATITFTGTAPTFGTDIKFTAVRIG